jgi:hypothetical protein
MAWGPFTSRLAQIGSYFAQASNGQPAAISTAIGWLGQSQPGPTIASHPSPNAARPSPIHHRANPNRASPKRADDRRQRHKKILVDNMSGRAKVNNHNHRRAPHSHTLGSTTPRQDPKSRRQPTSCQQTASQQRSVCACEHSFRAIPAWIRMPPRAGAETRAEPRNWRRILWTAGRQLKTMPRLSQRSPWQPLILSPGRLPQAPSAQRREHLTVSTRPRRWPRVRPRRSAWRASAPMPTLSTRRGCQTPSGT